MYKIIGADGKEYGPITADQVKQWIAEGRVNAQTQMLAEGETEWRLLGTLPGFFSNFPAQGQPAIEGVPTRNTNPMALIGMILGILAVSVGLCCCYGFPFNFAGIVFSVIALVQIKQHPERYTGKGMAMAGLILSILSILLVIGLIVFGVAMSGNDIMRDIKKF